MAAPHLYLPTGSSTASGPDAAGGRQGQANPDDLVAGRLADLCAQVDQAVRAVVAADPEGVHDLRVALRRARSCLRTFRSLLDRAVADSLRHELHWLAGLLGAARDPEVLGRRLERRLDQMDVAERMGPVRQDLVGACRAEADRGRAAVIEIFDTERYRLLRARLGAAADHPPYRAGRSGSDAASLRRCLRKEVRRTARRADRAEGAPMGPKRDAAFHEVRKAAKRVRYGAETLEPLGRKAARRMARRYEAVQDLLGERQDAVVARRLLVAEGARVGVQPAHNGFTYGVLAEQERQAVRQVDARWPRTRRRTAAAVVGRRAVEP